MPNSWRGGVPAAVASVSAFVAIEETHDGDMFLGLFATRADAERHIRELEAAHRGCYRIVDRCGPHSPIDVGVPR